MAKDMKTIKLFLSDVDGCMTDGGLYYTASGDEMKRFCVYDGVGLLQLKKAGIPCGILTSETSEIVARRAKKLKLDYLYMGVGHQVNESTLSKREACEKICQEMGITMDEVCFVGDDINDMDLLTVVGTPVCPQNARPEIKSIPGMLVLEHKGGDGAIREICEMILGMNNVKC